MHDKASLIIAFRAAEVFNSLALLTSAHKDFAYTLEVSCGAEIIVQVTFQAAACHELFSSALRKFLNIYLCYMHANKQTWQLQQRSKVASPPLPAQQLARAQLLRKPQEAVGFEIKELVLIFS